MEKTNDTGSEIIKIKDLDTVLFDEVGQFGLYQLKTVTIAMLGAFFIGLHIEYIFSTGRINTRCFIPECELTSQETNFRPPWISKVIPNTDTDTYDQCHRYAVKNVYPNFTNIKACPSVLFDREKIIECDHYVYENQETVVYDFGLACDEWKRTFIGFAKGLATFPSLLITGFISDRLGRRTALTINIVNAGWLGITKHWLKSYTSYIIVGSLETLFGAGVYSTAFIMVAEEVGPKYRVLFGTVISSFLSLGDVCLGFAAWLVRDWRTLPLIVYTPSLLMILFWFSYSESVRWYLTKGRYAEAEKVFKQMAKVNKKPLSDNSFSKLKEALETEMKEKTLVSEQRNKEPWLIVLVFRHKPVLIRCMVAPVWWITFTFVYYGMSINSVNLSGDRYMSFISVAAIDIPGFWIAYVLLDRIGRKPVLSGAYIVCAACHVAYLLLPHDQYEVSLTLYLVGKCSIAVVVVAIYQYTSELFPTRYRHSLLAFSSMVGRLGFVFCQLIPAFGDNIGHILFAAMSCLSGLLVFVTPETRGSKFPNTMEEAADMGSLFHRKKKPTIL